MSSFGQHFCDKVMDVARIRLCKMIRASQQKKSFEDVGMIWQMVKDLLPR
jgi:hypothetical protein